MINFEALLESTCCKFTHFIVRSPCRIHLFLLRRLDLTKEGKRHVRNPVKSEFSEKLKKNKTETNSFIAFSKNQ